MNVRPSILFVCFAPLWFAASAACGGHALDVGSNRGGAPDEVDGLADPSRTGDGTTASPNGACVTLGPTAKLLYEPAIGDGIEVRGLVLDGDTLWVDTEYAGQQSGPSLDHLTRVSVRHGTSARVALDGYRSLAGVFGGRLVYVRRNQLGPSPVEELVIHEPATGASEVVPNARTAADVHEVRIHSSGIYWLAFEESHTAAGRVSRFTTRARELMTTGSTSMVTDGRELFFLASGDRRANDFDSDLRLRAIPIAGGAPREVLRVPSDHALVDLVAADDTEVYFTRQSWSEPNGVIAPGDLIAVKRDGTGERVVVSGQSFREKTLRLDPDFITWLDGAIPTLPNQPEALRRVRRTGGAVELIPAGDAYQRVSAVTVDRCNVYWATTNPLQVYGRSRLP